MRKKGKEGEFIEQQLMKRITNFSYYHQLLPITIYSIHNILINNNKQWKPTLAIDPGTVDWSRAQFALTAIYHWLFVPLTLGLAVVMGIHGDLLLSHPKGVLAYCSSFLAAIVWY